MNKIPKIIHYCWFGENTLPDSAKKYIEIWKKFCPDYEIKEWNESNFDVNMFVFTKEAYQSKKYAFVSDVARLYVLNKFGGIYMDTDVELIKPLNEFVDNESYIGFQDETKINTALIASKPNHKVIKEFLDFYQGKHFIKEDGKLNLITNVDIITEILIKKGLKLNDSIQKIENITIYPKEYFSPIDYFTLEEKITENTVSIHWFAETWLSKTAKIKAKILKVIYRTFGKRSLDWLKKLVKK